MHSVVEVAPSCTLQASLKKVALLDDASRKHFCLACITVGPKRSQKSQELQDHCQEWDNPSFCAAKTANERVYRIKVTAEFLCVNHSLVNYLKDLVILECRSLHMFAVHKCSAHP